MIDRYPVARIRSGTALRHLKRPGLARDAHRQALALPVPVGDDAQARPVALDKVERRLLPRPGALDATDRPRITASSRREGRRRFR